MGRPKLPDRVICIDNDQGRWRVRFVERGVRQQERFFSKEEAEKAAEKIRERIKNPPPPRTPPPSTPPAQTDLRPGRSNWWRLVLAESAQRIRTADADPLQVGRVLASLGMAAARHVDTAELEAEVAELEEHDKAIIARKKHGPRSSQQNRPTTTPPVPGTQIR